MGEEFVRHLVDEVHHNASGRSYEKSGDPEDRNAGQTAEGYDAVRRYAGC